MLEDRMIMDTSSRTLQFDMIRNKLRFYKLCQSHGAIGGIIALRDFQSDIVERLVIQHARVSIKEPVDCG
jgi:hypothetical protein